MTEPVVIKQVGETKIVLSDYRSNPFLLAQVMIMMISLLAVPLVGVPMVEIYSNQILILPFCLMFVLNTLVTFTTDSNNYWKISLEGERDEIVLRKTTPEFDQNAICLASKELELKAHEYINHEAELKIIAEKCK